MFSNLEQPSPDVRLRMVIPGDWRRPDIRQEFRLYWRKRDQFGQLLPRPTADELASYYDIPSYYTKVGDLDVPEGRRGFFWRLLQHLAWRRDFGHDLTADWCRRSMGGASRRCIEIGCGNGTNLLKLQKAGHEAVGVEPDPQALEVTRSLGFGAYAGTAEVLPDEIRGQTFDWVFIIHALEHCIDPVLAVQNAVALVKEDGLIAIEVPNNQAAGAHIFGPIWFWLDVPRHLSFFTPKSLRSLIADCGLEPVSTEYTGFTRQFGEEWIAMQGKASRALRQPEPGALAYIQLLMRGAFAKAENKYDTVRVIARKPAARASA